MDELEWRQDAVPVSTRFQDAYYSMEDGRAETSHTFVQGNDLPRRWPQMDQCTIAELGFGTGLNFLETVRQWLKYADAKATLIFVSFEQYPLEASDLARALAPWKELENLASHLIKLWSPDFEILDEMFDDRVRLLVFIGDANVRLPQLEFQADAWYLDGFSPAKNPQLWGPSLMEQVALHTAPKGTFATYTSAGEVRRNLESAGFRVERTPGFGRKRHMSRGILSDADVAHEH